MSENGSENEKEIDIILHAAEIVSSGEDPPTSEWSSLIIELPEANKKRALLAEGLYSPGSGEVCAKYIRMNDSNVAIHPYYNYCAVTDPGIEHALLSAERPVTYADDGQDLYLALCAEINAYPVRIFHRSLLTDEIDLKYYGVNPNHVRAMAMALQYNKTVRCFNLTDNFLNNDACYHLSQMLITNRRIKELILAGCRIGAPGMLRLGNTLAINRSLEKIDISRCCLGESGGVHFAKQIVDGAWIPQVNLSNNQLGRHTAVALTEALEQRNIFTHLDLSWNNFFQSPPMAKMLSQLATSKVLQELNLSWNAMEGENIASKLKEILLIPKLKVLNLSNNRFFDDAVAIFLGSLIKAKELVTLDLSFNPLSPNGAYNVLEKMTRPRVKIQNLNLDGISVEKGFLTLLDKVKKMKTRKDFIIKYGSVLHNWTVGMPDARKLLLQRANFLANKDKKSKMDVALFFLQVCKDNARPIPIKELIDMKASVNAPLDDDLIYEMTNAFPGPKNAKTKLVDVHKICEYIRRIWPDKKLPPTPPPELEAQPEPPPQAKGKKGKK